MLATSPELDQVRFLRGLELGRLPPQAALGLGDGEPLAGAGPGEVGLDYVDNSGLSSRMRGTDRIQAVVWPVAGRVHPNQ
ncbi:hypothetical protein GCM10022204_26890 [Microlunatus aurantiacus]|uniref:Uncharacterized protein n=1 Tax=Microlunatus aurantiacus TaxID=446786 RepID=A0ABP7DQN5_9ACTN